MSLTGNLGAERHATVWLITSDGHVIPFHPLVLVFKRLLPCALDDLIDTQMAAKQPRISVPFDSQTVWRVLSYIYLDSYSDLDAPIDFPVVDPPRSPMSASNRLIDISCSDEETELSLGFRNLQVTPQACTSTILLKAWASMLVYRAATTWSLDRLVIESSNRFGAFVSCSSVEPDFPKFVDGIFKSVSDPSQVLYDHVVKECTLSADRLVENDHFLSVIQKNGLLGRLLFKKLTLALRNCIKSCGSDDRANLTPSSSASGPTEPSSASHIDSPAVAELKGQLTDAQNDVALKEEMLEARETEVSRLKENIARQAATLARLSIKVVALEARPVASGSEDPNLATQLKIKVALVDKLSDQLDSQDHDILQLKSKLEDATRLTTGLTREINSQRSGQRNNTDLMVERNEARQQAEITQGQLTASEEKVKDLEARLAAMEQELASLRVNPPRSAPSSVIQTAAPSQSAPSVQPTGGHRLVVGFGALTDSINSINAGTAAAPAPRQPPAPAHLPPALAAQSAGAMTFVQRMAARHAAAGIGGGEPGAAPASMTVSTRGTPHATERSSPTPSNATCATLANGVTTTVPPLINGVPHGPRSGTSGRRSTGPHAGSHASAQSPPTNGVSPPAVGAHTTPSAPLRAAGPQVNGVPPSTALNGVIHAATPTTQASTVGQSNAVPDQRDGIIAQQLHEITRLQRQAAFFQRQLNDSRNGPTSSVNTRGHGGPSSPSSGEDSRRLKVILTALKEYDLDHKACLDCSINFNSEWRGIVDDINNPALILNCKKCGEEKCRWRC